jgi:hypothetical protein
MSETPDIEYRGHFIQVQSYEAADRRWRPQAVVSVYQSGALRREILSASSEVLLDSEEAAETYSLELAKKWIDEH